MTTQIEGISS